MQNFNIYFIKVQKNNPRIQQVCKRIRQIDLGYHEYIEHHNSLLCFFFYKFTLKIE